MNPRHPLRLPGVLPAVLLLAGSALFARAAFASADQPPPPPGVIEEVRITGNADYVLERHIYFAPVAIGTAATADALAGVSLSPGGAAAAFVVNNHLWPTNSLPVVARYNAAAQPATLSTTASAVQASLQAWTIAGGGSFAFEYGGSTSAAPGACEGTVGTLDGSNTIAFVTTLPSAVLGQTCTISAKGGGKSPLVEFDMQIATDVPWTLTPTTPQGSYDLPSTILHELGHAAGIGHSSTRSAVMYASLANGEQKRVLTADDIGAINAAYPPPPTPIPTATPTPTPTPLPTPVYDKAFSVKAPAVARD